MTDNLSIAVHASASQALMSFSVDEMLISAFSVEMLPFGSS